MASCLVFRNDAPVIDMKITMTTPEVYFASLNNGKKEAYQVHEYHRINPSTKITEVYQIAYDVKPSDNEIEQAIITLKAVPI